MLQRIGVETRLISPGELHELAPTIWSEDLELAAYEPHSGYADPTATTLSLLDAARQRGAELRQQVEVQGFLLHNERVTGVKTSTGTIEAGTVVCAAGGWTMNLLETLGLRFPVWNVRHQVVILQRPAEARQEHMTYIDGVLDVYYRPDSPGLTLVGGGAMEPGVDPDTFEPNADADFVEEVAEKVSRRMPALADASYVRGWSGVFAVSADLHPLLGPVRAMKTCTLFLVAMGPGLRPRLPWGRLWRNRCSAFSSQQYLSTACAPRVILNRR